MGTEVPPPGHPPRVLNPLWIIALFLGLSETTVGIAAAQSSGWVQGLLAVFAVVFPVLVSTVFFLILWQRPEVLYAPGDFPEHVSIGTYVDGMRRRSTPDPDTIQVVVNDMLRTVLPPALDNPSDPSNVLEETLDNAKRVLAERTLTVDVSAITEIPDDMFECTTFSTQTVSNFLDSLWGYISESVPPFRYGRDWILLDAGSKKRLGNLGSLWSERNGTEEDHRLLSGVGITPESRLIAIRLDDARKRPRNQIGNSFQRRTPHPRRGEIVDDASAPR
ncbi:hypothetical protein ABZX90_23260 [Streptomyces sp. NPDC002935]|uniref:hypothetical protein n=1 Tax=Streptomyces sp. NPDC002935 TaxID=3154545 RepID=UPI0033B1A9A1